MPICSVGRIVHVYSPEWEGHRPGMIVGDPVGAGDLDGQYFESCNVNVFLDGFRDGVALEEARSRRHGNTLCHVPVFESMPSVVFGGVRAFLRYAVWPPRVDGGRMLITIPTMDIPEGTNGTS